MKQPLTVRLKILLAVAVSVIGLSVLVYLISTQVLLKSYLSIERDAMAENLRRATDALNEFSNQQMIKLSDWAQWDESYEYASTRDEEWVDSTTYPEGMANLDINISMYADTEGKVFHLVVVDIETRTEVASSSVASYFESHKELITLPNLEDATEGLVLLPDGPMVVVSLPLKTTEGEGPIPGTLTFGRYLDEAKIADFADITHLAITAYPYNGTNLPEDVARAKENLTKELNQFIIPLSPEAIAGYTTLYDLSGEPILIMRVLTPRPIFAQGNLTFLVYLSVGAVALLIFGALILFLLDRLVIARFLRLTEDVEKINVDRDLSVRLDAGESDEVGRLGEKINQLLKWLSEAREAETASRREIVNLLDELKKGKEQAEEMARILNNKK